MQGVQVDETAHVTREAYETVLRVAQRAVRQRVAALALHHSTPTWFVVGNRRETRNCCAECGEGTYWPCPTAQALGVDATEYAS